MVNSGPEARGRVWILGAGFSRSLGGPLMTDLMSLEARRRILATYADHLQKEDVDLIFWLFHCGAGFPEGTLDRDFSSSGVGRWRNAEEFLEILDTALTDRAKKAVVDDVLEHLKLSTPSARDPVRRRYPHVFELPENPDPDKLAKLARRMIAASCGSFLEGVDESAARKKERWLPFQQWLGLLREGDSILTFNYDRVIELLEPFVGPRHMTHSAWGVSVHGVVPDLERLGEAHAARLPVLYKLHGSVNWHFDGKTVQELKWSSANLSNTTNLAIATPGDSKMEMANGIFRRLWKEAAQALQKANEVYIIGFRFPASDAFPRDHLLAALRENDQSDLTVNVVLGPDQNADLRRVLALLRWTVDVTPIFDQEQKAGRRDLIAHSMWAEDFLSVWARNEVRRSELPMPWVD